MLVRVPPGEAILFFGMKSKNFGALLGLAWSFFRKTFFVFIIYIENGVYRTIGKKWPEFLTTLVRTPYVQKCYALKDDSADEISLL